MSFTLLLAWWAFPAAVTVIGLLWALVVIKGDGFMGGLDNLFAIAAVGIVSAIAWAIAGFFK